MVFSMLKVHIRPLDVTVSTKSEASIHHYKKWTEIRHRFFKAVAHDATPLKHSSALIRVSDLILLQYLPFAGLYITGLKYTALW